MKKHGKMILAALGVYLLLLLLLLAAEAGSPGASIRSFGDALWYSLITMTTVGYGDLAPVTAAGRVLGVVFALCSIGILTALIGLGLRLIGGEFLPRLYLRLNRGRRWYAFTSADADAAALARALSRADRDALLLFPPDRDAQIDGVKPARLRFDTEGLLKLRGRTEGLSLFCMGREPWHNYALALEAAEKGVQSYCMADIRVDKLPPNLQLFSPTEAMSRSYWKAHPLKRDEGQIVLIGGGEAAAALLERALLTNVFEQGRRVDYHVFGGTAAFAALHPETVKALCGQDPAEDRLVLHEENWAEARSLLQAADRIILCFDDDRESFAAYEQLKNWIPTPAALHVRLAEPLPGALCFGSREDSLRPEFVLKDELNRQAILMNDIYNEGAERPVSWRELTPFLRQSNIAAADHLIVKARFLLHDETLTALTPALFEAAYARFREEYALRPDALLEMEHRRWMRFYQLYNWQYAPARDNARRRHPLLLPYAELSEDDRRKDVYAWEMLGRLAAARAE